jgi:8-oxo-dGTP diphosphatase
MENDMQNPRSNVAGVIIRDNKLLLVEFDDDSGLHYNLPGGGIELNETLHDVVKREIWEETRAAVTVGKLLAVWESIPPNNDRYGNVHKITHLFACELVKNSEPQLSDLPDRFQVGVRWVAINEVKTVTLYPDLGDNLVRVIRGNLDDTFYGTIR